jgi:transcriptional regulator with GAF, ATPase, and Fis domain/predicted ATPase
VENDGEVRQGYRFGIRRRRDADGRAIIVKSVRPGPLAERNNELLRHEYHLLQQLNLERICRPLALSSADGTLAMLAEDAGAQNLGEVLGGRSLPIDRFLDLAIAMVEVVGAIHRRNLVHRDICPANFVVREDGRSVVLVDFESATTVSSFVERGGVPTELVGTIAYMAPEQTGRMKREVDSRADLYSLGATFYEMLTGAPPFTTSDPLAAIHDLLARAPFPPTALNPSVPAVLSEMVLRLLAKMPEHRYQTADVLLADLEEARRRLLSLGGIASFELAQRDAPHGLFVQAALYGRDAECKQLMHLFDRTTLGALELVMVTAPAGAGKSALIDQLRREVEGRSYFVAGKCDLLRGNQPYAPFVEAFAVFVDALADEDAEVVAPLKQRILEAVQPNGRVLTEVIPALERLIGAQPEAAGVGPLEAENRFRYTFVSFVRALAADSTPVVIFLDDLQWADSASLGLMSALASDPDLRSTLLLGTYRSEEVGSEHPVERMLTVAAKAGVSSSHIALEPLDTGALADFLADVFVVDHAHLLPLAALVRRKTGGNPFFVRRLLAYLYRAGLIARDSERATWTWDLDAVAAAGATDHVVALLEASLAQLPPRDQSVLKAAACIGNLFDLTLLAVLCDQPPEEVATALWAPLEQGLLVPSGRTGRWATVGRLPVELGSAAAPSYRFAHDRIQQVAYELNDVETRQSLHLRAGRELERVSAEFGGDAHISEVVDQLNRAAAILPVEERTWLARLNLRAGEKAVAQTAHVVALGYFEQGLTLLPDEAWASEHRLWFALVRAAAEVASWVGEFERCDRLVAEGLRRAQTLVEKAAFYRVAVLGKTMRPETLADALKLGVEALRLLGCDIVLDDPVRTAAEEMERSGALLKEPAPTPSPRNAEEQALDQARMDILLAMASPAWYLDVNIGKIVIAAGVRLFRKLGYNPQTAFLFSAYAVCLAIDEKYEEAFAIGQIALSLVDRFPNPAEEARTLEVLAAHVLPWRAPVTESVPLLRRGFRLGVQAGDLLFAAHSLTNLLAALHVSGTELNGLLGEINSALAFYRRAGQALTALEAISLRQAVRCLKGMTRSHASFDDDEYSEKQFLADASLNPVAVAFHDLRRLQVACVLGQWSAARPLLRRSAQSVEYFRRLFIRGEYDFYAALTVLASADELAPGDKAAALDEARVHLGRLQRWAHHAPDNYRHKHLLVAAELARVEGRSSEVLPLFIDAVEAAERSGSKQDAALACECAGRFLVGHGQPTAGVFFLGAASERFARWGAAAKVEQLEQEFGALGLQYKLAVSPVAEALDLDFLSLFKAAETLTSELVLDRLLPKLARLCAEAASAERAVLILDEGGLVVRATLSASGEVGLEHTPLSSFAMLPRALVEQVFRSGERVLLGDAAQHGPLVADAYVAENGVRSLLALPIRRAERPIGVFYFENNLASDAFVTERVRLLDVLSSQIAICLENSLLYEERQRSEQEARFIAEASKLLAETLDFEATLSRVALLAVPLLADWCVVDLVEDGAIRRISGAHVDAQRERLLRQLEHPGGDSDAGERQPFWRALKSGLPYVMETLTGDFIDAHARNPEQAEIIRELGAASAVAAPLIAHGHTLGAITFVRGRAGHRYGPREVGLAEEVARRAAAAIENARLYHELQRYRDRLLAENLYLQEEIRTQHNFEEIIGQSPELLETLAKVERVATTDFSVLILGETGTGKELIARAIHSRSQRRDRPLVKCNCGALTASLVESELFGHVKGAFTGALQSRAGRFALADGGTLFLDEVGELPLDVQVRLLRVLQEQEFEPVGSSHTQHVDVRILAATNRDLDEAVRQGRFRADLLYRLNVFPIRMPALRERCDDIPLLADFFIAQLRKKLGRPMNGFSKQSMARLLAYSWPGNVRELQNVVDRAALLANGPVLEIEDALALPPAPAAPPSGKVEIAARTSLDNIERDHILRVLRSTAGVIEGRGGAALQLGMHPNTLRNRMKKLGIRRQDAIS